MNVRGTIFLIVVVTLIVTTAALPAQAGDVILNWDASAGATGYRVHYGQGSGQYGTPIDVGNTTSTSLDQLGDCTEWFFATTAYNQAGESGYSMEVSSWPRPRITAASPASAEQGAQVAVTFTGANFQSGASIQLSNPGVIVNSISIGSCTSMTLNLSIGAGASPGPIDVTVTHPDGQVSGVGSGVFSVAAAVPPSVVSTLPADGATNVVVTVQPTVQFSEPLLASTVNATTVRLLDDNGNPVAQASGYPLLNGSGTTVTIDPATDLVQGSTYRIQVVGGSGGVTDVNGNPLASTYIQSTGFQTEGDITAPSISSVQAGSVTDTSASINWTTDEPADSQVFYRQAGQSTYQQTSVNSNLVTSHVVALQGLSGGTTYEYHVRSADGDGNASTSSPDQTFTTSDSTGPAISSIQASVLSGTSVEISWSTDESADGQVFYRASGQTNYQQTAVDSTMSTSHSIVLQGLSPDTDYDYHVRSVDNSANPTTSSPDDNFTTGSSPYDYVSFETEAGVLTSPISLSSGTDAFGGQWIDTPNGTNGTANNPAGTATFGVNVPSSGTWYLWVRIYGPNAQSNAWFESIDGASRQAIATTQNGIWQWVAGRQYTLSQGLHVVELGGYERRARADRILLTDDPDFVPTVQPDADVTPPQAVSNFVAVPAVESVELSWTNPVDSDFTTTVVRYRTDGEYPVSPADGFAVTEQADLPGTDDGFTHSGLTAGTTYSYSAFAIDASGNVSVVAQVQAVPDAALQPPQPPANLIITRNWRIPDFLLARFDPAETPWSSRSRGEGSPAMASMRWERHNPA